MIFVYVSCNNIVIYTIKPPVFVVHGRPASGASRIHTETQWPVRRITLFSTAPRRVLVVYAIHRAQRTPYNYYTSTAILWIFILCAPRDRLAVCRRVYLGRLDGIMIYCIVYEEISSARFTFFGIYGGNLGATYFLYRTRRRRFRGRDRWLDCPVWKKITILFDKSELLEFLVTWLDRNVYGSNFKV